MLESFFDRVEGFQTDIPGKLDPGPLRWDKVLLSSFFFYSI